MDLSRLNTTKAGDAGATLHILHPTTEVELYHDSDPATGHRVSENKDEEPGRPMTITGYGSDSNVYRRIQADMVRKQKGKRNQKLQPEEIQDAVTEQLASVITGWTEFEKDGEPFLFSKENAIDLLTEYKWIREQWAEFINDRANFLHSA